MSIQASHAGIFSLIVDSIRQITIIRVHTYTPTPEATSSTLGNKSNMVNLRPLVQTILPLPILAQSQSRFPDCTTTPLSQLPICDVSLPAHSRAQALVAALTLAEKINNTGHESPGSPRLGLPAYNWWNEALQLGYFDPADGQALRGIGWEAVATGEAGEVARAAATQGSVLLKNVDGTLPLKMNGTLALVGPYINLTTELQSNYAGPAKHIPTMIEAAQQLGYTVLTAQGTGMNSTSSEGFEEALGIAAEADAVVFFGGIDNSIEESLDRTRIDWPGNQEELILALGEAGKPLTVVQFGGGQVDDAQLLSRETVGAIVWVGYPSQAGGAGVFDVLTGKVAPAGRLPITQYPKGYVDEVPMTDMNLRPGDNKPGRTYRWYDGAVLPFGFGLHYTTFNVSWAKTDFGSFEIASLTDGDRPDLNVVDTFSLAVTNTGDVASDYVALVFASAPDAGPQPAPIKTLVGYTRASQIKPGEMRKVDVEVTVAPLTRGRSDGSVVLYPGTYTLLVDVNEDYPTAAFEITGRPQIVERFPLPGNSTA
ncbi:glycosyl hydrolase family 3 C-terminal domain-containing protein [Aspergillus aurantiobrunneus]